ncbi:MAG: thioredoxin-disulfide reductase [Clostridiales bacterium]|uniref:Thioredoxin reductase n=1 Tax=Candidatus Pullilachnospira stercoravium TaxID=2840913 RepID=A0A9D1T6F8_9FIRM|nr:thioredoxin-disulfide reductase [Clostridiales bacterium]HIV13600.1 thioredoxin-disulfide reductase [Candidatus Pullilachnospira stercoravium]
MEQIYDVLIIGSGPAGMTAAIYGKRAGLSVAVLEGNYINGGQILNTYEVDNYPGLPGISGLDLADKFKEHAASHGAEFLRGKAESVSLEGNIKVVHTRKEDFRCRTLVIASGAVHRKLGVPGEETLNGMGVSYCATCDGAFFRDKTVAVVGGGDVAVEDAIFLARGCRKVYVIHRRDQLRAAKTLQDSLFATEGVEMYWNGVVTRIDGENKVQRITVENTKTGESQELEVDGVFIAVGITPDTGFVKDFVELDSQGYIIAGEDGKTSVPGVFAAGDVRTKQLRQVITAAADGANCITSAEEYLRENPV